MEIITILDTYLHNRNEYNRKATESARKVGKDIFEDFLGDPPNIDRDHGDYQFFFENEADVPSYMKSQISVRVFRDPVIPPSCGQIYERDELKQLIAQNKNPICVNTGLPITETILEVDQLKSIFDKI